MNEAHLPSNRQAESTTAKLASGASVSLSARERRKRDVEKKGASS